MRKYLDAVLVSVWFVGSLLTSGDPDWFSRMGALGVAFVLIAIAIQNLRREEEFLPIQAETQKAKADLQFRFNKFNMVAHRKLMELHKISDPARIDEMAEEMRAELEKVEKVISDLEENDYDKRQAEYSLQILKATTKAELFLLVGATIQWGFGDLMVGGLG